MDREHWKKMLPYVTAFSNGETVEFLAGNTWNVLQAAEFLDDPNRYRIAKPKERVPLEAEDWIKDGPWWVRGECQKDACMVSGISSDRIHWMDKFGKNCSYGMDSAVDGLQRRNAASHWMPCWKEKE